MWNKLLERQIRRYLKSADISGQEFQDFFTAVSQAYSHMEEDRNLIERSLDLSSRELSDANRALQEAGRQIEMRNKEMISSLEYARLVQTSLLARESTIYETFADSFVLNQPRDIVGGDFFWVREEEEHTFVCVADCTGHGVPGAFMSVISFRLLNQAVRDLHLVKPNEILTFLNDEIKRTLSDQPSQLENRDALDISLVVMDKARREMHFSGLGQRILICRGNDVQEIRGDRAHIGQNLSTDERPISRQSIPALPGDQLYLFTDGLIDQFGGPDSRKFGVERLKNFVVQNAHFPLPAQKKELKSTIAGWQGDRPQVDDMLVVGLRL
jgi:serine phosphatase RsbU (regulator of sigma subunit)